VEAFFLNACGSLGFAEKLVERGAAAGAATTRAVFGETAGRVGCNWARLLAHGWTIERALDVARSVDDPAGYVAVGDGTHILTESTEYGIPEYRISDTSGSGADLTVCCNSPISAGGYVNHIITEGTQLAASERAFDLSRQRVQDSFSFFGNPVLADGDVHWNPESLIRD
jgi:hypothetical protein